ncbi:MAG: riboflavin synthase [Bdellovibrionales bacterium]|nr:riboflavin synthase [Bdellovibrionales bacterium]
MFSGIVECQSPVLKVVPRQGVLEVHIRRPGQFNQLSVGDSISVDGVCLTIESCDSEKIVVALAAETLQVTQWDEKSLLGRAVNLERSLSFGDRVHGHLVTGHVDVLGEVAAIERAGECSKVRLRVPQQLRPYFWKKGSLAVNGVSLTINQVDSFGTIEVCLIPETLRSTNLGSLQEGDRVSVEADNLAKGLVETVRGFCSEELSRKGDLL